MKSSQKPRVLCLHYHDAPYRTPVLDLTKRDPRLEKFQLAVMFPEDQGHSYWEIDYESEDDIHLGNVESKGGRKWHPMIRPLIKSKNYDCLVINGFYHYTSLYLLWIAFIKRVPAVFISDNVIKEDWGYFKRCYESLKIRLLNRVCKAYWVPGQAGADYLKTFGEVDKASIFSGAYTMESSAICADYSAAKLLRQENRRKLGFSGEDRVLMMAANFLDNRQHVLLVRAFLSVQKKHQNLKLVLLGEGANLEEVKAIIQDNQADQNVLCKGGVGFAELARYYSLSDVYVHSGAEPYSTAVMYAALVGMPLLLSESVGAILDVLQDGSNGYSFASSDQSSLEQAMERIASLDSESMDAMGARSAEISEFYTPSWGADQLIESIYHSIG